MAKKLTEKIIAPAFTDDDILAAEQGKYPGHALSILSNQRVIGEMLRRLLKKPKVDREALADLCHRQWSGWMEYLFKKSRQTPDGSVVIPRDLVERWWRQVKTPYDKLSPEEQDSDRKEADRFLKLIK